MVQYLGIIDSIVYFLYSKPTFNKNVKAYWSKLIQNFTF